jgi:hypothetical protein
VTAGLDQLLAILWNRSASVAQLRDAAAQAREAVTEIDAESEAAPSREAATLARMMSPGGPSTVHVLEELQKLDDESASRALRRKVATALAAALDVRVREIEAREAAKPPEQVRREQEQARREAELQALFARFPVLFRTDYVISLLGKSARSRAPRPQGRHTAYAIDFSVPRVLATQDVMTATRVPEHWPPRHSNFALIQQPNYMHEEIEDIVGPLRLLCQKSAVSEDEVSLAIDRAQAILLTEFARVCAGIRKHFPGELPRSIVLPAIGSLALAAE